MTSVDDATIGKRGAVALMVIALTVAVIGYGGVAVNDIIVLVTGAIPNPQFTPRRANLDPNPFSLQCWIYLLGALSLAILLVLTRGPARQFPARMVGIFLIYNSPGFIALWAFLCGMFSLATGLHFTASGVGLYWIPAVVSFGVMIGAAVIDYRQRGVIFSVLPFIRHLRVFYGRKNKRNRIREARAAVKAYAAIPNSARLPVLTKVGRWAFAPLVTLVITVVMAAARFVSPLYVLLALVGASLTGLCVLVLLFNVYARKTGTHLDLSAMPRPIQYLSDQEIKTYKLRLPSVKIGFLSGFVELAVYAICVGVWLTAVILWAPILAR